jgi:heptaprenyl diphosphate synthase
MRMLPVPFIRIGLSNIIVLYLIMEGKTLSAVVVNVVKSLIGGIATLTLLTPGTLLSLVGGLCAIIAMLAAKNLKAGFTVYGISILGAVAHNLAQLVVIRYVVMLYRQVFMLTPILIFLGMFSGILTAWLMEFVRDKIKETRFEDNEKC